MSRVKKIIRLDEEVSGCSNNAAFLVTVAAVCVSRAGEEKKRRFNSLTVLVTGNVRTVFGGAGVEDDTRRPETTENDAVQRPWFVHLHHHHELADGGSVDSKCSSPNRQPRVPRRCDPTNSTI